MENKTMVSIHYTEAVSNLNNVIALKKDPATIQRNKEVAEQAIKAENMRRVDVRVEALVNLFVKSPVEFWAEYLNNATVPVLRLTDKTNDDGLQVYSATEVNKYVSFGRLETAYRKLGDKHVTMARVPSVYRMLAYFTDNLTRYACHEMGVPERKVSVPVFNYNQKKGITPDDRKTLDFSKVNNQALANQLDAIVMNLLPEGFCPHMRKCDLEIVRNHHFNNKARFSKANSEANTIENILEVVRLRINNAALTVKSGAVCHAVKTENSASQH